MPAWPEAPPRPRSSPLLPFSRLRRRRRLWFHPLQPLRLLLLPPQGCSVFPRRRRSPSTTKGQRGASFARPYPRPPVLPPGIPAPSFPSSLPRPLQNSVCSCVLLDFWTRRSCTLRDFLQLVFNLCVEETRKTQHACYETAAQEWDQRVSVRGQKHSLLPHTRRVTPAWCQQRDGWRISRKTRIYGPQQRVSFIKRQTETGENLGREARAGLSAKAAGMECQNQIVVVQQYYCSCPDRVTGHRSEEASSRNDFRGCALRSTTRCSGPHLLLSLVLSVRSRREITRVCVCVCTRTNKRRFSLRSTICTVLTSTAAAGARTQSTREQGVQFVSSESTHQDAQRPQQQQAHMRPTGCAVVSNISDSCIRNTSKQEPFRLLKSTQAVRAEGDINSHIMHTAAACLAQSLSQASGEQRRCALRLVPHASNKPFVFVPHVDDEVPGSFFQKKQGARWAKTTRIESRMRRCGSLLFGGLIHVEDGQNTVRNHLILLKHEIDNAATPLFTMRC